MTRRPIYSHPLTGKVLRWTDKSDETYSVRRFIEPVTPDGELWLMEYLCPVHGEPVGEMLLMRLSEIAERHDSGHEIYDSFAAMVAHDRQLEEELDANEPASSARVKH